MTRRHWFVEEEEGWEDGCWKRTTTYKPIERQEAELIQQALELKELARAQQKLLEPYRNRITIINAGGSVHRHK